MDTLERQARQRAELRRRILGAARELFGAGGYDGVTPRAVAERIEHSPAAIYGYFPDKHSLIRSVCEDDWRCFGQRLQPLAEDPDPLIRLRSFTRAYIHFARSHPHQYRLLFMTAGRRRAPGDPAGPALPLLEASAFLRQAVGDAIESNRFLELRTDLVADALWLALHGVAARYITRECGAAPPCRDPGPSAELLVDALLRGFLRDPDAALPGARG